MSGEKIVVLDFGGQYTQLIAKIIRQCNVFSEIKPHDYSSEDIIGDDPKGIILSGGPDSVYSEGAPQIDREILELGIPVLGICYGMQLVNYILGGGMIRGSDAIKEYGESSVMIDNRHKLYSGLNDKIVAWMSHGDSVDGENLADGFNVIGKTVNHVASITNDKKNIYGVQFHPEVTHTPDGKEIISNFVHGICGCGNDWTMGNYIEQCRKYIQKTVGSNDVINFVSGGVDSSFVAVVLSRTEGIGKVYNVYIGALMRKNENKEVVESLKGAGVKNLIFKECEDRFIEAVSSMSDPEQKRKAIGNLFGKVMQEVCEELKLDPEKAFLGQGTLYTDQIESGKGVGNKADKIKSHHNVGCPFIEEMKSNGRLVEPNSMIFKDEVRKAAKEIGLPASIYERQPFPGPGIGIRVVDADPEADLYGVNSKVDGIARQEGLTGGVVPVRTVGVQGDGRTYSYLAVLRGKRDWEKIRKAAKRIPQEVREVNRIVYDLGEEDKEVDFKSIVKTGVSRETVDLLKDVDLEGRKIIDDCGPRGISQTIFVLFGSDMNHTGKRSVALRAVSTDDFMTVRPVEIGDGHLSWECLDRIHDSLVEKYDVGAFVYDVTDKPPATTCWE